MKHSIVRLSVLTLLLMLLTPVAFAQATRTWVSGVGDDANPCSRTAPCKTWAGAISKTAPGGEMDALDPGGFGALTITKAITLDGGGGQVASILVSGTNGIQVVAGAADTVILRNLRINGISGTGTGGLNGIRFLSGKQLVVENCDIFGFTQNGIDVALNQTTTANVVVHNTNFTLIGQTSVSFGNAMTGTVNGSLSNVAIRGTASGVIVNTANALVDISNSTITQATGFALHSFLGTISAENNMLTGNTNAVRSESGSTVRLSNNGIYNNGSDLHAVGTISSAANNRSAGNSITGAPNGTITVE